LLEPVVMLTLLAVILVRSARLTWLLVYLVIQALLL
jgi:hypothetical protein